MADTKISALPAAATLHADDLLIVVDTHDTSEAATGTDKALTPAQLLGSSTGDVSYSGFAATVTKTNGVAFAASATTDTRDAGNINSGTLAAARLPTVGLAIDQHSGAIGSAADGATITFDLATHDKWTVTGGLGGNRTLALANPTVGQQFTIILPQDATGSRTVTWFSGVLWPGGTTPTLTTTASKRDVFTFLCISAGVYLGFTAGLNH